MQRVAVDGKIVELYTVGYTAKLLNRSKETIRLWEKLKVIPRPMYKHKNVRLYHPIEVQYMKKALLKVNKQRKKEGRITNADIKREMYAHLKIARQEILNGNSSNETQSED